MKKFYLNLGYLLIAAAIAIFPTTSAIAMSQDETVYAKLQRGGEVFETSVVKHLINDQNENQLFDQTNLTEIENLNGFEKFSIDGQQIIWETNGEDIYYSGNTDQELPIKVATEYKLNGELKSLDQMLDQSGKIELSWKFTNLSKIGELYTPFVVGFATALDETKISNLSVTNGKTISNGRSVVVTAAAAPGLYESLQLAELGNFNEITITYDTEKFELSDVYMIVTPKLLDDANLQTFTELDQLYADSNALSASSQQLVVSTGRLHAGILEFKNSILAAKQKFQSSTNFLDAASLTKIKNTAKAGAERRIEAERETIVSSVKSQVENNSVLMNALKLQASEMCKAQIGRECDPGMTKAFEIRLVASVEEELTASSVELARTTATQVATATAEQTASSLAGIISTELNNALATAFDAIIAGVDQLLAGATELNSGMQQFNNHGIQPLTNFVNHNLKITSDKIRTLTTLAAEYNNFSGLSEGAVGETKFIFMIEGKKEN